MKYIEKKGLNMSVFSLGTVQLGMNYGIAGKTEKPSEEYAHEMLDCALSVGVNNLDTANNYGDSERVIGTWLKKLSPENRPLIITKTGPYDHSSPEALRADIYSQTEKCLETLGVDTIDILMVHAFEHYIPHPEIVKECFDDLKARGIIKLAAISVYSNDDYELIAKTGFDAVQIPLNIFDWSKIEDGGIQRIADAGMMIFVRSVFLQGLVFLTPETLSPRMAFAKPYLERFLSLADEFDMTPDVLAASFVFTVPGVTSVVLGCQTPEQIKSNAALIDNVRKLTDEEMSKIREAFVNIDPVVVNPRLWPKA